jgi:hypothetical protein
MLTSPERLDLGDRPGEFVEGASCATDHLAKELHRRAACQLTTDGECWPAKRFKDVDPELKLLASVPEERSARPIRADPAVGFARLVTCGSADAGDELGDPFKLLELLQTPPLRSQSVLFVALCLKLMLPFLAFASTVRSVLGVKSARLQDRAERGECSNRGEEGAERA